LYGGNLGSIFTSNNPQTPGKDKHMQVRFFKHRGNVKSGQLRIKFIGTKENISDFFTKAPLRAEFYKSRALCMHEVEMAEVEISRTSKPQLGPQKPQPRLRLGWGFCGPRCGFSFPRLVYARTLRLAAILRVARHVPSNRLSRGNISSVVRQEDPTMEKGE